MKVFARGTAFVMTLLAGGALLTASLPASAQTANASDKGVRVEDQDSMAAVLKRLEGKAVKIRLAGSGDEIAGKIQKVGKDLVHLSDIGGREYFDAVVRVDQVSAVIVQVRGR
jgi:hypothetical protein